MKKDALKAIIRVVFIFAIIIAAVWAFKTFILDKSPKFSVNDTEFDLDSLYVEDLNKIGANMYNNEAQMPGHSYDELLKYYVDEAREVPVGGLSIMNFSSTDNDYARCKVFEISANLYTSEGEPTNLNFKYEGQEVLGKTADEIKTMFGQPYEKSTDTSIIYKTKRGTFTTTFTIDSESGVCTRVLVHKYVKEIVH